MKPPGPAARLFAGLRRVETPGVVPRGPIEHSSHQAEHFPLYAALDLLCLLREIDLHRSMGDIEQGRLDVVGGSSLEPFEYVGQMP